MEKQTPSFWNSLRDSFQKALNIYSVKTNDSNIFSLTFEEQIKRLNTINETSLIIQPLKEAIQNAAPLQKAGIISAVQNPKKKGFDPDISM